MAQAYTNWPYGPCGLRPKKYMHSSGHVWWPTAMWPTATSLNRLGATLSGATVNNTGRYGAHASGPYIRPCYGHMHVYTTCPWYRCKGSVPCARTWVMPTAAVLLLQQLLLQLLLELYPHIYCWWPMTYGQCPLAPGLAYGPGLGRKAALGQWPGPTARRYQRAVS